jgi:Methylase involved in ubiquinone/menaquinone biosynthesis
MDFGTYHHSSRKQSELIRERIRINLKKLKILKELDKPLNNVIDIGFGLGFFSYEISKFLKIKNLVGLDTFDERYIKNLNTFKAISIVDKISAEKITLVKGDASDIPFKDSMFELAISNLTLHNLPNEKRSKAFNEIFRTLKNGGIFIYSDFIFHKNEIIALLGSSASYYNFKVIESINLFTCNGNPCFIISVLQKY